MSCFFLVPLLLLLAVGIAGQPQPQPQDCGTCESLGYTCIGAEPRTDLCGAPLQPSDCPIPDCHTYCAASSPLVPLDGFCDEREQKCSCFAIPQPTSAVATACDPLTCGALARNLTCIPPNNTLVDPCTNKPVPANYCPQQLPLCYIQCNPATYASLPRKQRALDTCSSDGRECQCGSRAANAATAPDTTVHAQDVPDIVAGGNFALLDVSNFTRLLPAAPWLSVGYGCKIGYAPTCLLALIGCICVVNFYLNSTWQRGGEDVDPAILEMDDDDGDALQSGLKEPIAFATRRGL